MFHNIKDTNSNKINSAEETELKQNSSNSQLDNIKVSYAHRVISNTLQIRNLTDIINDIRTDSTLKQAVDEIRDTSEDSSRKELKKNNLPIAVFGLFKDNKRSNANFISSQFIVLDYDHLGDKINDYKTKLKQEDSTFMLFTSPSGDGLKVVYRLDEPISDPDLFSNVYKHYVKEFGINLGAEADDTSDAARACFLSHDPEIYVNDNAVPLKVKIDDLMVSGNRYDLASKADDNNITELLNGGLTQGQRHEALVKIVASLNHFGMPESTIIPMMLNWNNKNNPPKNESDIIKEVKGVLKSYGDIRGDFWTIRRNKFGKEEIKIDYAQYIDFLERSGFSKLYISKTYTFIKEQDNKIVEVVTQQIKDQVIKHIRNLNYNILPSKYKNFVLNEIYKKNSHYFGSDMLECVTSREPELLKDTKSKGYVFYKNGAAEVTKDKISFIPYKELNGIIWEKQMIDREFSYIEDYKNPSDESVFGRFVWNISGSNTDRFYSLISAIGYLLNSYKNASSAKAIVFCDEKISEAPNGRTGKSLVSKAISQMKNSVRIDGKRVDFRDRFVFQQVDYSTQIIEFNDVRRNFDFESLFSVITDALNIEKKNGHKYAIEFEDSPKILISTNYTIKGTGDSFKDRLFEVEFSGHYNTQHKPKDDFGCLFFDEWDEAEWNKFDNFMLMCEQFYLEHGLVEYEKINLGVRKLMDNTSPEFITFARDIEVDTDYEKNQTYTNFTELYSDFSHIKQRTFTSWLKIYAEDCGYRFETRKSNSKDYFCFTDGTRKSLFN